MVKIYSADGKYVGDEPPYTEEEEADFYRRIGGGFDYWRFDDFMDRSRVLLDTFLRFRSKIDEGIQAEKISRGMT